MEEKLKKQGPDNEQVLIHKKDIIKVNLIFLLVLLFLFLLFLLALNNLSTQNNIAQNMKPIILPSPTIMQFNITPTSIPTPTINYSLTKANDLSNKVIMRDGNRLLVSDFDGNNIEKLTDNPNKLGYIGISNDKKSLYYSELIGEVSVVYKKDFSSGSEMKLFTISSEDKNVETFFWNAVLSPDERSIIYSHNGGDISIYDLEKKSIRKLLTQSATCNSHQDCYGFYFPLWSPTTDKVIIRKILYEGAKQILINPFDEKIIIKETNTDGDPVWSPEGTMIVVTGAGYGPGGISLIKNVEKPTEVDVFKTSKNKQFQYAFADTPLWVDNNKVAFMYSKNTEPAEYGIAIYNTAENIIKSITTFSKNESSLEGYISERNALLYSNNDGLWSLNISTGEKKKLTSYKLSVLEVIQ